MSHVSSPASEEGAKRVGSECVGKGSHFSLALCEKAQGRVLVLWGHGGVCGEITEG